MTAAARDLARPVLLIYWLTLAGGLALFAATRSDGAATTAALLVGALGGTLLGHALALRNVRLWLAAVTIAAAAIYADPLIPDGLAATRLWQAFIPAALCAFWSLGDRSGLVAAWFPAVIWMLSILDRAGLALAPDGTAAILLAGLAALFIGFLHARETRRVGLWRSVAADPIAAPRDLELLRHPPARHLPRAAWWLSVAALTAGIMVWLVPPLWQRESLGGATIQITEHTFAGLRCCPTHRNTDTETARIKEYLGLGLGHDERAARPREGVDCRICDDPPRSPDAAPTVAANESVAGATHAGAASVGGGGTAEANGRAQAATESQRPGADGSAAPNTAAANTAAPNTGANTAAANTAAANTAPSNTAPANTAAANTAAANTAASNTAAANTAAANTAASNTAAANTAAANTAAAATTASNAAVANSASLKAASPTTAAPMPASSGRSPPAPIANSDALADAATADAPRFAATGSPMASQPGLADAAGPSLLGWLALAVVAAAVLQLARLALRPLRRLVTLRHLRRPFWDETVAQRVSNAWQLALIGLRDAGWRTTPGEAPRELARRVSIDGVARCAAILERARHGVGLDTGDLAEMQTSADATYHAARRDVGRATRALSWLRWPLT